jgi:hypothetical protein
VVARQLQLSAFGEEMFDVMGDGAPLVVRSFAFRA